MVAYAAYTKAGIGLEKVMTLTRTQFTTAEVCEMTGATPRQLQWWDERGHLSPARDGRRRLYSERDIATVRKILRLRDGGVGAKRAAAMVAQIEGAVNVQT